LNAAFGQVLLGTCDIVAGGKIGDDLLSDLAAGQLAGFGVGEVPLEVVDVDFLLVPLGLLLVAVRCSFKEIKELTQEWSTFAFAVDGLALSISRFVTSVKTKVLGLRC